VTLTETLKMECIVSVVKIIFNGITVIAEGTRESCLK